MHPSIISASILSADWARFGEEAMAVLSAGADSIHFDAMDNHYVPNLSFGPELCKSLRHFGVQAPIDVHLMAIPVDDLIKRFAESGATSIIFHPEASKHIDRSLGLIRDHGLKAGLAFNPASPLNLLPYIAEKLDIILVMSVNPGFSGQSFIPNSLEKIREAKQFIQTHNENICLSVDGGIQAENIQEVKKAGADTFVSGSSIFGSKNYRSNIQLLRDSLALIA